MKHILLAAGLLGLASCGTKGPSEKAKSEVGNQNSAPTVTPLPAYHTSQVAHSANLLLTTASYTGVILQDEQPVSWAFGLKSRAVTPAEVVQAEAILQHCASPKQVTWYFYKSGVDSLEGRPQQWADAIGPLRFYNRQYRGFRTADGQRVVWINAFPKEKQLNLLSPPTWQTAELQVDDGGKGFFNIYVNLDKEQCFNFIRNSEG